MKQGWKGLKGTNTSAYWAQWGSVNHQMAIPVPSISCCVFNNNNFFYQEPNELAFNWDACCHLVICLRLIASHYNLWRKWSRVNTVPWCLKCEYPFHWKPLRSMIIFKNVLFRGKIIVQYGCYGLGIPRSALMIWQLVLAEATSFIYDAEIKFA